MDYEFDFDTFLEDPSNHFAYALCKDIVENLSERENPFWIYGPTGCGKSHLLGAIRRRLEATSYLDICVISGEEAAGALLASMKDSPNEWNRIKACDVLLVDHIDCVCGRPLMQKELAQMLLDKCAKGQQVVIVSSCQPSCFPALCDAFTSQSEKAMIAYIAPPSQELCRALVARYREQHPFPATDTALAYLIENARSFVQLRGALNAALFWHQTNDKKVTLWWAKKYMCAIGR